MKSAVKHGLRMVCSVAIWPAILCCHLQALAFSRDQAFRSWMELFSLLPGITGVYLRNAFLRGTARRCDPDAWLGFGTLFSDPDVSIGRTVYIGNHCSIGRVTLEDDVLIASHVSIMNGCHQHGTQRLDIPVREQPGVWDEVTIGRDTWIGERATVAASVGQQCIVGAGSVVLKPVPDFAIVAGVPARQIGDRRTSPGPRERPPLRLAEPI